MAVSLLAPIPEEHLLSGALVCQREGQVAYGSRAWELFRQLDAVLAGEHCNCYIYASDQRAISKEPLVTWRATYIGHVEGRNGAHPQGMKFRPPTTEQYPADNKGHWAVFWHLSHLDMLPKANQISIRTLRGFGKLDYYAKNFRPEGPLMIESP